MPGHEPRFHGVAGSRASAFEDGGERLDSGSAGSRLAADRLDDSGAAARVQGRSRLLLRPYGRRRRILVNRRYQLKTALVGVTGMGFLVALTLVLLTQLHAATLDAMVEAAPSLAAVLAAAHRRETLLVGVGGATFMGAVFLAGIWESRRTAGPILNLRRRLEEVRSGRLRARVVLRRHDNFPELAAAFNEMTGALRARAEGELATLGRLAGQVAELLREEAAGNRLGARRAAEGLLQSLKDARRHKEALLEP